MDLLTGKVAVVTGVGPGLGRGIALALAEAGASVVTVARSADRLASVVEEIVAAGGNGAAVAADITDPAACARVAATAVARFGRLDVLVNSAFVQPPFETIEAASMDTFRSAFEINVFAHVQMTQAAIPAMRAAGGGSIVFINTMSTRRTRRNFGIYTASKMALLGVAKVLAVELGPDRIRVNSVHPGYIWGDSVQTYLEALATQRGTTYDDEYEAVASETPLHHLPTPEEIAQAVVFLAADKMSSSITGESVDVNAGQWIR
jgi:NAD(P)-dependent dehydrogenase (short-subunit alcohol dehydrogenase family)